MEKIASFQMDHTKLQRGIYVSRVDGDVITYDIRMKRPNLGDYMDNDAIHTLEHVQATYIRNSAHKESILYFGPMGCRTGFYLLTRDSLSQYDCIALVRDSFAFVADYEGEIPGNQAPECGNYREHSLSKAKAEAAKMVPVLENWTVPQLDYQYSASSSWPER